MRQGMREGLRRIGVIFRGAWLQDDLNFVLMFRKMLQQARHFAARVEREAGSDAAAQVNLAFRLAFVRPPTRDELAGAQQLVRADGLFALCRMLLNANEFVYLD